MESMLVFYRSGAIIPSFLTHTSTLQSSHCTQVNMDSIPVFYRGGGIVPRQECPRP